MSTILTVYPIPRVHFYDKLASKWYAYEDGDDEHGSHYCMGCSRLIGDGWVHESEARHYCQDCVIVEPIVPDGIRDACDDNV